MLSSASGQETLISGSRSRLRRGAASRAGEPGAPGPPARAGPGIRPRDRSRGPAAQPPRASAPRLLRGQFPLHVRDASTPLAPGRPPQEPREGRTAGDGQSLRVGSEEGPDQLAPGCPGGGCAWCPPPGPRSSLALYAGLLNRGPRRTRQTLLADPAGKGRCSPWGLEATGSRSVSSSGGGGDPGAKAGRARLANPASSVNRCCFETNGCFS